jgi:hypothetical protein
LLWLQLVADGGERTVGKSARGYCAHREALTGKKIYEIDLDITGTTDYGVTMDSIMSGKAKVQGAQFDVAFVGTSKGVLAGKVHGVDYLVMRADGRTDLRAHRKIPSLASLCESE